MSVNHMRVNPKEQIAKNIKLLMDIYDKSRKEVCEDLDIRYTTFCDWYNGKVYPKLDNLESMAYYFRIDTKDFFIEIEKNERMLGRLQAYAERIGVNRNEEDDDAIFTVADYNETPEGYPVELINGRFYVMESPSIRHQNIVMEVSAEIRNFIKENKGQCRVFPGPFDVELPTKKSSVVVPDITVVCNRDLLNKKRCVGAPDWIIEVFSKSTADKDAEVKKKAFEEVGVREYWMVDQFEDKVYVYRYGLVENVEEERMGYQQHPEVYTFSDRIPVGIYDDFFICFDELDIDDYEDLEG